jgi:peptidoglycan hydrolase-like protein with peptidoglycan-binding domain
LTEDAPSYVVRKADSDLYQGLKVGEFCYVFNSRQMGKTSLQVRIMKQLEAEGFVCTAIDISGQGSQEINIEQWYTGIAYSLATELNFIELQEFFTWWDERAKISPVQRLSKFLEEVMLARIKKNIIIFIDEIDSTLSLEFGRDDFFAFIRSCHEKRSQKLEYKRLNFVLVGVATPSDLISDKNRTPFNIGRAIQLNGFQEHEIEPLALGLVSKVENPQAVMREVLAWTGGQPFLTQKICKLLAVDASLTSITDKVSTGRTNNPSITCVSKVVSKIVKNQIIKNWESQDEPEHLRTIRDRILRHEQIAGRLLGLYQKILQKGEILADDSTEQMKLRLCGLVVEEQGKLKVYNKIYAFVFNLNWVERQLANLRPYAESFRVWVDSKYQDESRLLRGKALQEARVWAEGKSLSDDDYKFLGKSGDLEKKEVLGALEAEQEANQILASAQQKAEKALNTAKSRSKLILFLTIIGAMASFTIAAFAFQLADKQSDMAQQKNKEARQAESQRLSAQQQNQNLITQNQEYVRKIRDIQKQYNKIYKSFEQVSQNEKKVKDNLETSQHQLKHSQLETRKQQVESQELRELNNDYQKQINQASEEIRKKNIEKEQQNSIIQNTFRKAELANQRQNEVIAEVNKWQEQLEDLKPKLASLRENLSNPQRDEEISISVFTDIERKINVMQTNISHITRNTQNTKLEEVGIINLQSCLKYLGYFQSSITSKYDYLTEKAFISFQLNNKLPAVGVLDEKTLELLQQKCEAVYQKNIYINVDSLIINYGNLFNFTNEELGNINNNADMIEKSIITHTQEELGTLTTRPLSIVDAGRISYESGLRAEVPSFSITGSGALPGGAVVSNILNSISASLTNRDNLRGQGGRNDSFLILYFGDRNQSVSELQSSLQRLNYFQGNITGYFGDATREAVYRFQRDYGLRVSGIADDQTLTAISRVVRSTSINFGGNFSNNDRGSSNVGNNPGECSSIAIG